MIASTLLRPAGALFLIGSAALVITGAGAKSRPNTFVAVLNAGQLVPSTADNSFGVGVGTLEPDGMFCFSLSYSLEGDEDLAHIHGPALPGTNAGVRWDLEVSAPKQACVGPLTKNEKKNLRGGLYYFVVHTADGLGRGGIRGQIVPVVAPGT